MRRQPTPVAPNRGAPRRARGHPAPGGALDQARSAAGTARTRPQSCPVSSPTHCASVVRPTGWPPKRLHKRGQDGPVDLVEAQLVHPEELEAIAGGGPSMKPSPRTSAKSRTRRSSRLATRGVPRERSEIRMAPFLVDRAPSESGPSAPRWPAGRPGHRGRAGRRSRSGPAAGPATSPVRVVAPTRVNSAAPSGWNGPSGPCRSGCRGGRPPWPNRASPRRIGAGDGSRR